MGCNRWFSALKNKFYCANVFTMLFLFYHIFVNNLLKFRHRSFYLSTYCWRNLEKPIRIKGFFFFSNFTAVSRSWFTKLLIRRKLILNTFLTACHFIQCHHWDHSESSLKLKLNQNPKFLWFLLVLGCAVEKHQEIQNHFPKQC